MHNENIHREIILDTFTEQAENKLLQLLHQLVFRSFFLTSMYISQK